MNIRELIQEKLPGKKFGIFHDVGEGLAFPNGEEEISGSVVDEDGNHWAFWTSWYNNRVVITENDWLPFRPHPNTVLNEDPEYIRARAEAGLGDG